jgi:GntR family transcriptional regulator, transcriptional repressor for pyruvate dehydrogenase complex
VTITGSGAVYSPRRTSPSLDRPKKYAVLIAHRIVSGIISGELPPGSKLPPEKDMIEQYQAGRGTLREALRYLELQGVLAIRPGPGGGPVVTSPTSQHLASTLGLLLALSGTPFRDIVNALRSMQPNLAVMASQNRDEAIIQKMRDCVDSMQSHLGTKVSSLGLRVSNEAFWEENNRFYDLVAEAAGNNVLRHLMSSLHWIIDCASMDIEYSPAAKRVLIADHRSIIDAIAARDAATAGAAMQQHVEGWTKFLTRHYADTLERKISWDEIDA